MEEEGYDADTELEFESNRLESSSSHASSLKHYMHQNKYILETSHCQDSVAQEMHILYPDLIKFVLQSINETLPVLLAGDKKSRYEK